MAGNGEKQWLGRRKKLLHKDENYVSFSFHFAYTFLERERERECVKGAEVQWAKERRMDGMPSTENIILVLRTVKWK